MNLTKYTIVEARSEKEWEAFFAVPERIYCTYPWMSPLPSFEVRRLLDTQKNPFFVDYELAALVCYRNGVPTARMTVHIPRQREQTSVATFGFFECIEDVETCAMMFEYAGALCRKAGMTALEGPYNPSARSVSGIQLNGFENPTVLYEPCNPPYYCDLLSACGYESVAHGYTWTCEDMERFRKGSHDVRSDGAYRVWHPHRKDLRKALADLSEIMAAAFNPEWRGQSNQHHADLYAALPLLDGWADRNIAIAYHGELPVGAIICALDINPLIQRYKHLPALLRRFQIRRHLSGIPRLVFYAMAMKEEYRSSLASYLLAHSFQKTAARFDHLNSSWITSGNRASESMARRFGFEPWKKFALYGTCISHNSIQTPSLIDEHGVRHE